MRPAHEVVFDAITSGLAPLLEKLMSDSDFFSIGREQQQQARDRIAARPREQVGPGRGNGAGAREMWLNTPLPAGGHLLSVYTAHRDARIWPAKNERPLVSSGSMGNALCYRASKVAAAQRSVEWRHPVFGPRLR
eukprot:COSAG04_NODE_4676_length_1953_cov_5.568501_5_plen_135_part_00